MREDLERFLRGHRAADARLREEALRRDHEPALDRRASEDRVALRRRLASRR